MLWKIWNGRILYQSETGIRVLDNYFFRILKFNSSPYQTVINTSRPQKPSLPYIQALNFMAAQQPGHCLLLGLGGAGVAHALSPFLKTFDYKITAVEISQEVIAVAQKYFMIEKISNLTIIHADANHFVQESHSYPPFKHILIDLSDAERFPPDCNRELFFAQCKARLAKGGFLAINLANRNEQRPIFDMLKKQFSSPLVAIPLKKCANMVIVAAKDEATPKLLDAFKASQQVQSLRWDSYWGCVAELTI